MQVLLPSGRSGGVTLDLKGIAHGLKARDLDGKDFIQKGHKITISAPPGTARLLLIKRETRAAAGFCGSPCFGFIPGNMTHPFFKSSVTGIMEDRTSLLNPPAYGAYPGRRKGLVSQRACSLPKLHRPPSGGRLFSRPTSGPVWEVRPAVPAHTGRFAFAGARILTADIQSVRLPSGNRLPPKRQWRRTVWRKCAGESAFWTDLDFPYQYRLPEFTTG